jgi:hypothetical protein
MTPLSDSTPFINKSVNNPDDDKSEDFISFITDYFLTAGENEMMLFENETMDISKVNRKSFFQCFYDIYLPTVDNWLIQEPTQDEKNTLFLRVEDLTPTLYFKRIGKEILKNPHLFSEKTLQIFCDLYVDFYVFIRYPGKSGCQIL